MSILNQNYRIWETKNYFIEAVIENLLWEKIIDKSFEKKLNVIIEQILKSAKIKTLSKKFSISILLTGDKKINQLNKNFRKINAPTNVLSFPSVLNNINTNNITDKEEYVLNFLGDIVISYDTLIKEAKNEEKPIIDHFIHLFIHGVLHLLGYDHENDFDAKIMEALEIKILKSLSINNPYL